MAPSTHPLLSLLGLAVFASSAYAQCPLDKLTAGDAAAAQNFGQAVAISGGTLFVGAPHSGSAGAAYVNKAQGKSWVETDRLTAGDGTSGDAFGRSVAVSGDWAVVGAPFDDPVGTSSGSAYVFESVGSGWVERQKLVALDAATGDNFGFSVSIAGDVLVVGAPFENQSRGAVYVFERSGSSWLQVDKLTALDADIYDVLGWSVSTEGGRILAGAPQNDDGASNAGSAYVFEKPGTSWFQYAKLVAGDAGANHAFGSAVSVAGNTAIVGAPGDDSGGSESGSGYVFDRSDTSWPFTQKLTGSGGGQLGTTAAVGGGLIVLGAPETASSAGVAHLYELQAATWVEIDMLAALDAQAGDEFGEAVALSGERVVVGAPDDGDAGGESGSAWVFSATGSGCPTLFGSRDEVSISDPARASQLLFLVAGTGQAGNVYLLLGSSSGTMPGLLIGGVTLPLKVPDAYFDYTLTSPNSPILTPSLSVLDSDGSAQAAFTLPAGTNPALAGRTLYHAYLVIQLSPFGVTLASDAEGVELIP